MKEMLARHKGKLILSSLVILLPILPAAFAGQNAFSLGAGAAACQPVGDNAGGAARQPE